MSLKSHELALHKLFSSDYSFEIPDYQRPYSWEEDQANQLFDDLFDAYNSKEDEYFLGSIVVIKKENIAKSEVIDGQQRLTTLTILLAELRNSLSADSEFQRGIQSFIMQPGDLLRDIQAQPRLKIRQRDSSFFSTEVQNPLDLDRPYSPPVNDAQKRIDANKKLFIKLLDSKPIEEKKYFTQFIINKCHIVLISSDNYESAYRIFSIMNSRGLDLTLADILKSELIGNIESHYRDEYTNRWEETEERLGREVFNDLFSHYRMIVKKQKYESSIIKEIREHISSKKINPIELLRDQIFPYADILDDIIKERFDNKKINNHIKWLKKCNNKDWIPAAILIIKRMNEKTDSEEIATKNMAELEKIMFSMFLTSTYASKRIRAIGKIIYKIESGEAINFDPTEKESTLKALKEDVYKLQPRLRRLVMTKADSLHGDQDRSYDNITVTIEHILPQSPKQNSQWVNEFDWSDDERNEWAHKIGNLALLSRKKNSSAGNKEFRDKLDTYFRSNNQATTFPITLGLFDKQMWTPNDVKERQDQIILKFDEWLS
ncbi:DUF262 domain-containing protein [Oceanospirillum maris]|uniref:DUF262 domain-containing protein n=1 Tax=Oceanospirillum maris TaxID=64977 RepID=UPI00040A7E76|nr:DUF262 domain-containing protein [Oceanospirillum maris]